MGNIANMWTQNADLTLWQSIWISSIFFCANIFLCVVNWFLQKETILECGYSNSAKKKEIKKFKTFSIVEKITLVRLVNDCQKYNPIIPLCVILNAINLLAVVAEIVGYISTIITRGHGWAIVLTLSSGFTWLMICTAIRFLPDLLYVPSERRRYGINKKKK